MFIILPLEWVDDVELLTDPLTLSYMNYLLIIVFDLMFIEVLLDAGIISFGRYV